MKTRIEIKGDNKQVKAFTNTVDEMLSKSDKHVGVRCLGTEYTRFNEAEGVIVALQPDRRGVDVRELLSDAKELADSKEVEYDALSFNIVDDWCEDTDEYTTTDESETFHVEESTDCWEIYSSVFGDDEPAQTYRKCDYSLKEAIADYKENGIY